MLKGVPWWVNTLERVVALSLALLLGAALWKAFVLEVGRASLRNPPPEPAGMLVIIGIFGIVVPVSLLCANLLSWSIPALRKPNDLALRRDGKSWRSINLALVKYGLMMVLAGFIMLWIATIQLSR